MNKYELMYNSVPEAVKQAAAAYPQWHIARVATQYQDMYLLFTAEGELLGEISGRLRYGAESALHWPLVGDYVMIDRSAGDEGNAIIHVILPRFSLFQRKAAGSGRESQGIAANVDTVFICMALNEDYNLRRLERYLAIAWESGALPVVVLTKADLCEDLPARLAEAGNAAPGAEVVSVSSLSAEAWRGVEGFIKPGRTVAFMGSSGVGKSTLINRLLGEEALATGEIRADGRGRHITTNRQLIVLPEGGMVIDTPGMRELGLDQADLARTFAEIEKLAAACRFADCSHENEPGCAVQAAVENGSITGERLASYKKLQKEKSYDGLDSRQLEQEKINNMFGGMGAMKELMRAAKAKNRRRQGR